MSCLTLQRFLLQESKRLPIGCLASAVNAPCFQETRRNMAKHWNPKFKALRTLKVIKVDLPNYYEKPGDVTPEERVARLKEKGIWPAKPYIERPTYLSTTSSIFEPYVPPEGDGKMSAFSKVGAKQKYTFLEKKSKSMMAVRKIRKYEEDYDPVEFAEKAQELYIAAHEALAAGDKNRLIELVTERAYPEMLHYTASKTLRWKFLKSLEPPRVVQVRCTDLISKANVFAQVTVRFHTQQSLAIYDRFGRLMHGSETVAKDVLEYVIFENNVSNSYGIWRLHAKIIPEWAPPREPTPKTYVVEEEESAGSEQKQDEAVESVQVKDQAQPAPA